ncbi:hypothetical protein F4808DRAFT_461795 [Astrocystis sublimbata]|nr:hypothetical protein F4808DRAFT_461795 [Astrocystis sublimbata]
MQISHVLLGLVATASAVDIYAYRSNIQCKGNDRIICQNIGPDECCSKGAVFRAFGFEAIPSEWQIICRAYNGGQCNGLVFAAQSNSRRDICLGNGQYTGANYAFTNKKRSVGDETEEDPAASSCKTMKKFDRIEFGNGINYNITGIDDAHYEEMVSNSTVAFYIDGGKAEDVPKKFDAYLAE